MFCSRCRNKIQSEAKYCSKCGCQVNTVGIDSIVDEWFYISNSQNMRCGHFSKEEMMGFVQNGHITNETFVWKKGMSNWLPAAQTELVHAIKNVVPLMPNNIVNSKYAWSLATVPILVSWLVELIGFSFWAVIICTILLNIIFLTLDCNELKKSGLDVNRWMWMGLVLVPAYLFVRASKTNKEYGYAITWCVMLFFDLLI